MRRSLSSPALALLAFFLLSARLPAAVQPSPPPAPRQAVPTAEELAGIFSDSIDVQAVQLNVVVTDEQGGRIPGLTAADFRLRVEGEEVPIELFSEVRDGQVVAAPTPEEAEAGNNYLIFIDDIFSQARLRDEALQGIATDLKALAPQDRVAIVAVSRQRLEILTPWTRGGPELNDLMARMIRHTGPLAGAGLRLESPDPGIRTIQEAYQNHLDRLFAESAADRGVTSNAVRELNPLERAGSAAAATLRALAGVPGRKVLVLLSGGWMATPKSRGSSALLFSLVNDAIRLGFTVYPVYLVFKVDAGMAQVVAGIRQGSLKFTAIETGGKLLMPGRNRHLGKVAADTHAYYRLGFTFSGDDRQRDIQIEVRRPGAQVRAPESFVPLSRRTLVTQQVDTALLNGALTAMPLTATAGDLRATGKGRAELPLTVQVPVPEVASLIHAGRRLGQLELRVAALADDGSRTVITSIPIWVVRDDDSWPAQPMSYEAKVAVEHKPQYVQLMLVDVLSGKCYASRLRVEPGKG